MKRVNRKKVEGKIPRSKVVANEKIIPNGLYCYEPIPNSEGKVFNEEFNCEVPTFKVKNCPYLKFEIFEEDGFREVCSFCTLLDIEIDDEIKGCGINVPDEVVEDEYGLIFGDEELMDDEEELMDDEDDE